MDQRVRQRRCNVPFYGVKAINPESGQTFYTYYDNGNLWIGRTR
jgi:hypothetical protein